MPERAPHRMTEGIIGRAYSPLVFLGAMYLGLRPRLVWFAPSALKSRSGFNRHRYDLVLDIERLDLGRVGGM